MRLTKREKLLIIILVFAGAGYLLFQHVITPQLASVEKLVKARNGWEQKKQELTTIDKKIEKLDTELSGIDAEIQTIGNRYFSLIEEQEEIIVVLNELLHVSGARDTAIAFEPLKKEPVNVPAKGKEKGSKELMPTVQNIRLSYEGDYKTVWNLLRGLWSFEKNIMITDFSIASVNDKNQGAANTGDLTGDIVIRLYDMSDITQNSGNLVQWTESGSFRRGNPFEPGITEVFPGTRYILNRNDTKTSKYVKFADISGHWAESAIDSFGSRQLISGDLANRYFPDSSITRGELVIMLDKAFKWEAPPGPVDLTGFSDYSELGQSMSAMEKAFYKGYLNKYFVGYGDGSLKPNAPITYEEYELVMGRVLKKPDFKWSEAASAIEANAGYKSPGINNSSAFMTRAEAVYFLNSLKLK